MRIQDFFFKNTKNSRGHNFQSQNQTRSADKFTLTFAKFCPVADKYRLSANKCTTKTANQTVAAERFYKESMKFCVESDRFYTVSDIGKVVIVINNVKNIVGNFINIAFRNDF